MEISIYQFLSLLGFPSICLGMYGWAIQRIRKTHKETDALRAGLQALLRSQMITDYNTWSERGYAPIYARENFENCWKQYHQLGANGVMDDIHNKFISLPTDKKEG